MRQQAKNKTPPPAPEITGKPQKQVPPLPKTPTNGTVISDGIRYHDEILAQGSDGLVRPF